MLIEALITVIIAPIWIISGMIFYKLGKSKSFSIAAFLFSVVPIFAAIAYNLHVYNESSLLIILSVLIGLTADVLGGLIILDRIFGQLGFQYKITNKIAFLIAFPLLMWLPFILLLLIATFPPISALILEGYISGILVPIFLLIAINSWVLFRKRAKGAGFWMLLLLWAMFAVCTIIASILTDIFILHLEVREFEIIKYFVGIFEWLTALSYLFSSIEYSRMIRFLEEELMAT